MENIFKKLVALIKSFSKPNGLAFNKRMKPLNYQSSTMEITKLLHDELNKILGSNLFSESSITIQILYNQKHKISIERGNDISITISCKKNRIEKYDIKLDTNYLCNNLKFVREEAMRRGLEYSIEDMRLEIIDDLQSVYIANYEIQNVIEFTNIILTFQYLIKFILGNLKLPRSIWYSKDIDYNLWKKEYRINPIVAGNIDGFIDEIIAIPKTLFGIYEIFLRDGVHERHLANYSNSQAFKNMMIDDEVIAETPDEELRMHRSVQSIVSVSFLMQGEKLKSRFKQNNK